MDNFKSVKLSMTPNFVKQLYEESKFCLETDVFIDKTKVVFITHTPDFSFYRISNYPGNDMYTSEFPSEVCSLIYFRLHSDKFIIKRLRGRLEGSFKLQMSGEVQEKQLIAREKLIFLLISSEIRGDEFTIDLNIDFDFESLNLTLRFILKNIEQPKLFSYKISSGKILLLKHVKADRIEIYSPGSEKGNSLLIKINEEEFIGYPCSIFHASQMNYIVKGALIKLHSSHDYDFFAYTKKAVFVESSTGIENTFTSIEIDN